MFNRKRMKSMLVMLVMLSMVLQPNALAVNATEFEPLDVPLYEEGVTLDEWLGGAYDFEVQSEENEASEEFEWTGEIESNQNSETNEISLEEGAEAVEDEEEVQLPHLLSGELPEALLDAKVVAEAAIASWEASTNWGIGGANAEENAAIAEGHRNSALAAVVAAIDSEVQAQWVGTPIIEFGVNIFDGPFFGSLLQLTYIDAVGMEHTAYVRSLFIDDRRIEWNSYYWDNRNMFPADGIARSDMERNIYDLVQRFGTSRTWGGPNIVRVADYIESEFLGMGFAEENVEIIRVGRRDRGLNPDGSALPDLAIPWAGLLTFNVPGETNPLFSTFDHYGVIHYGGMVLPGNEVAVGPEDWPFEAITNVSLVDAGIYPILSLPEGTTGNVIAAVRFVEPGFNLTTQLGPALEALEATHPGVNIQGAVVARTGRVAWQRMVPAGAALADVATSPFPVIMSSCMNLIELIER